jgi:hypothetical protein
MVRNDERHASALGLKAWEAAEFEFAVLDALLAPIGSRRRLVLVPVGGWDIRTTRPLDLAWRAVATERRALHVATDEEALWRLGQAWMSSGQSVPLHTVEDDGGVAPTLARVVALELAAGFEEVVLIVGRIALTRRRYRLLHDRTADAIAHAVGAMTNTIVGLMNVATV